MTTITVCVPAYNAERYLARTLDALLAQTYTDLSIVVVDDASTDRTAEIAREYATRDARVALRQHETNSGGCGLAIQELMAECATEFFSWTAADDEMAPEYYETLVGRLRQDPALGYVYSNFTLIDAEGRPTGTWRFRQIGVFDYVQQVLTTLSGGLPMNGVYRVSSLRALDLQWLLYQGETLCSDTISGLHFRGAGLQIALHPTPLFHYRMHDANLSKDSARRAASNRKVLAYIFEHFADICEIEANRRRMSCSELRARILAASDRQLQSAQK
jgi:glycosyltransferase involved in cell wall biosynthesis